MAVSDIFQAGTSYCNFLIALYIIVPLNIVLVYENSEDGDENVLSYLIGLRSLLMYSMECHFINGRS